MVAAEVEQQPRPEQNGGGHHQVGLGALHRVVQAKDVVQDRPRVGPRQIRPHVVQDILNFLLQKRNEKTRETPTITCVTFEE